MKLSYATATAMLACTLTLAALPAQAQNSRSFISSKGLDTNACTLSAPCRTFQRAHDVTNANGEIDVLDTAGYGPVTITKGISIINDGTGTASLVAPAQGGGITVNAGINDKVRIRGLTIDGAGNTGAVGINFQKAAALTIENCSAHGNFIGFQAVSGAGFFAISDSSFSDNSFNGIYAYNGAGGTIERTRVLGNQYGVDLRGGGSFAITTLNASGNKYFSILASGAVLLLRDSTLTKNGGVGVSIDLGGIAFLTKNLIASNATGIQLGSGSIAYSYGDNAINWNGTDLTGGTLTAAPLK